MYKKAYLSAVTALLVLKALIAVIAFGSRAAYALSSVSNIQFNKVFAGPFPTNKQNEPFEPYLLFTVLTQRKWR